VIVGIFIGVGVTLVVGYIAIALWADRCWRW
jgi:hypothetical protein